MPKSKRGPQVRSKVPHRPPPASSVPARPARRPSARTEAIRRRRNRRLTAIAASAVVLIAIAVLIVVKLAAGSSTPSSTRTTLAQAAPDTISSVPVNAMIAAAQAPQSQTGTVNPPINLPPSVPALTSAGKPEILYVGAEYCPFCAAERWPLVMALSKFGTFSNLGSTESSSTDVNPDTPTFTFAGSSFTSPYVTFVAVETYDRAGRTLQAPTPAEERLVQTYDAAPYTSGSAGEIPFIDLGGRYLVSGAEYDDSALSGVSFDTALADITSNADQPSKAVEAVAAHLVGVICSLTKDQPSAVCSAIPPMLKIGQTGQGSGSGG